MPLRPRRPRKRAVWYENESPGLGVDFERAIDAALDLLEASFVPLVAASGGSGARGAKRLLLRRFPYALIVRESATEVLVVAIAHTSRRPGYWRDRLK